MRPRFSLSAPTRRRRRLVVEFLEGRELPASLPLTPGEPTGAQAREILESPLIQSFSQTLYPAGTPQPTARELIHQYFTFSGEGTYTVGPGRFASQEAVVHAIGKSGTSNQFLRGRFQFVFATPNPSSASSTGTTTGVAHLVPFSFLQSSSSVVIDLSATATADPKALPTHFTWTHDTTSGTGYTGAGTAFQSLISGTEAAPNSAGVGIPVNFNLGTGVMDVHYFPSHPTVGGATGSGRLSFTVVGLLNNPNVLNVINKGVM